MSDTMAAAAAVELAVPEVEPFPEAEPFATKAEFYALDRFHAATHIKALDLPAEVTAALLQDLEKLAHSGPVHVVLAPFEDGPFAVRAFDFVRV